MEEFLSSLNPLEWILIWALCVISIMSSVVKIVLRLQKIRLKRRELEEIQKAASGEAMARALRVYIKASSRMKNHWSESAVEYQNYLWRELHQCEHPAREALEKYDGGVKP